MDVFNALWDNPEQRKRPDGDGFEMFSMQEWLSMSATHKILTGSFQNPLPLGIDTPDRQKPVKPSDSAGPSKPKEASAVNDGSNWETERVYIPGLVKAPILSQFSSLSQTEQKECLRLLLKYKGKTVEMLTPVEKAEYQLYQSLYSRVQAEQKEYLACAKDDWPSYVHRASRLKGDPYNFYLQHWQKRVARVKALYPGTHKKRGVISLNHKGNINVTMNLIKNILNIGRVPVAKLPEFKIPFKVTSSLLRLRLWGLLNVPETQLDGTLHKIPVSKDPNAERIARLHVANVVISSSAFKCLVDNHDENKHPPPSGVKRSWTIPVTVKEHRTFCDGKPVVKTIVYLDNVLPPARTTSYAKVNWYYKNGLGAAVVHRHFPGGIEFDIKGTDILLRKNKLEVAQEDSKATPDQNKLDDYEKEPSERITDPSAAPEIVSNPHEQEELDGDSADSDSDDECALTIALPDEEAGGQSDNNSTKVLESGTKAKDITDTKRQKENIKTKLDAEGQKGNVDSGSHASNTATSHEFLSAEKKITAQSRENIAVPPSVDIIHGNALPVSTTNVTYNLWSFESIPKKAEHSYTGTLDVLIRSRIDACEMIGSGQYQPLSLAAKPEFQLEYGAGAVPLSDFARQWAKLRIQPDSLLARVRINVQNGEFVQIEKQTQAELENEVKALYQEDLNESLASVYGVLSDLTKLQSGEYLLVHCSSMGPAAELFVKSNEKESADKSLLEEYKTLPIEIDSEVPWQQLSPSTIMPKNYLKNTMPCTFLTKFEQHTKSKKLNEKHFVKSRDPKFTKKKNKKKKGKAKMGAESDKKD